MDSPAKLNGEGKLAAAGPNDHRSGHLTPWAGQPPMAGVSARAPHNPPPWFLDFGGVWRRHRTIVWLALLVSALAGYFVGAQFKTNFWAIEGRLRFVKSPPPDNGKVLYEPMSIATSADLIASRELLDPIASDFADRLPRDNPIRFLQKELKVDTPRNADIIEIKFDAADPKFGVALVNRVMERHIEFTNQIRQETVLRQAGGVLRHKIVECDASIRKIKKTVDEYMAKNNSNTPIEKLDNVELDSNAEYRRKQLMDDIEKDKTDLKKLRIELDAKQGKLRQLEQLLQERATTPLEVADAKRDVNTLKGQVGILEGSIARTQEKYRLVPIDYANSKMIDLEAQKTYAQMDLKTLEAKIAAAKSQAVSIRLVDTDDEDWAKLRQRLLGPDNAEFDIIKPATEPAFATLSNRKALTALAFAIPMVATFLLLAFSDYCRGVGRPALPNATHVAVVGPSALRNGHAIGHDSNDALAGRIQQWIAEGEVPPPLHRPK